MTRTSVPPATAPPSTTAAPDVLPSAYAARPLSGWDLSPLAVLAGSDVDSTVSFADLSRRFVLDLVSARVAAARGLDQAEASLLVLRDCTRSACALLSPYVLDGSAVLADAERAGLRLDTDRLPDAAWFGTLALCDAEPAHVGAHVAGLVVPVSERVAEACGRAPAETAAVVAEVLAVEVSRMSGQCERLGLAGADHHDVLGAALRGALEVLGEVPRDTGRGARAS